MHQLRYQLAFGNASDHELAAQGHAYLTSLTPLLVLLAALVAAELLARFSIAWRHPASSESRPSVLALATAATTILIAIFAGQEVIEGLTAAGHPGGLMGVFGEGGWWSVPLAIAFGWAIALLLRGAAAAIAIVSRLRAGRPRTRAADREQLKPDDVLPPLLSPLAGAAAGRAPPLNAFSG